MSEVTIKVDTGFVGATHESDTGMSVEEWKALSHEDRMSWFQDCINDCISAYAEDEEGNSVDVD